MRFLDDLMNAQCVQMIMMNREGFNCMGNHTSVLVSAYIEDT